jgi:predicted neutral ceramidase superfamily lipid hydrolase
MICNKWLNRTLNSKREFIIYVVIFFWIYLGSLALYYSQDLADVSVYFLSLTGFIMSYIFGESVRKTSKTSIFLKGKISKRELMTYIIMLIWVIIGTWTIVTSGNIVSAATYFGSLTPFVGAYIIGETYKKETPVEDPIENI